MKIWCLFTLIYFPTFLFAQNSLGPRLMAMAENGAAVQDAWSIQANPSGITNLSTTTLSLAYTKHLFSNEVSTQAFVAVFPIKNNFPALSAQRYGFSAYSENKIGFGYAKKFGSRLSLGLNFNYHQLKIAQYGSTNSFSVDVGAMYQFNTKFLLGIYTSNPSKQNYTNTSLAANIPTSYTIGASFLASDKVLLATTVAKIINQVLDVRLGIDYKIIHALSLRAGLSAKPFKQYFGFGLNYRKFKMDMASAYNANLGYSPQISIGYAF
ncbi:hypothetical protein [Pedobacter sp. MW01-1-1]|uniref:hypothetical protein n=1 Tax=Pedobacter sp. MW01-1-1 TaxID=3383027 RepID=UPI003FF07DBC